MLVGETFATTEVTRRWLVSRVPRELAENFLDSTSPPSSPPLIYCLLFVASPRLYAELFRSAIETIRVKAAPVAGSGGYLRVEEQAAVCASRRIKNRGVFGLNASHCGTLLRAAVSETRTREREREREGGSSGS